MAKKKVVSGGLRYMGKCSKCGIAMYEENGVILTAGKSDCPHVLTNVTKQMRQHVFYLPDEDDAYLNKRAKANRCTRGEYFRALIEADRKLTGEEPKGQRVLSREGGFAGMIDKKCKWNYGACMAKAIPAFLPT